MTVLPFSDRPLKNQPKCARCRKKWRVPRYLPYCSYHCQEWAQLENAQIYIDNVLKPQQEKDDE